MMREGRFPKVANRRQGTGRLPPGHGAERAARMEGYRVIAGIDEAGRGPLAGPVVAAAVILPAECRLPGLADSKSLDARERQSVYRAVLEKALGVAVGRGEVSEIERLNILRATHLAMYRAAATLYPRPDFLLVDGYPVPGLPFPHRAMVGGDALSVSIAAASVVAKVVRDRLMDELDRIYPRYGFSRHKGYATPEHLAALHRYGPCPAHRLTFRFVRQVALPAPDPDWRRSDTARRGRSTRLGI